MSTYANITLVSGADPEEFELTKASEVSFHNACVDVDGNPAATTLSCDDGLFASQTVSFPMEIGAGETVYVQVLDPEGKHYYYDDPSIAELAVRSGRIRV
jgi:hypothetical protein